MPEQERLTLSERQVTLLRAVIAEHKPSLLPIAERVARGDAVSDVEANDLTAVLADVMMEDEWSEGAGFTPRGSAIDEMLGVVQQMSEDFYR